MTALIATTSHSQVYRILADLPENFSAEQLTFFRHCISRATCLWAGYIDGELVGMWGVVPPSMLSDRAYLWLYHTGSVKGREFVFIRQSRIAMGKILDKYSIIRGHCAVDSERSIRWLKWLGARFEDPQGLLIPFEIRRA